MPCSPGFSSTSCSTGSVSGGDRPDLPTRSSRWWEQARGPGSKRRVTDWLGADAALPEGRSVPSLDRLYRALDAVADAKDEIESHCFSELCNLANLDLRLACYDLTSTYFEGEEKNTARFPSKAFGYSRDHRGDRPQIVIGLLVTSDGIPIAHQVFAGKTSDISTLTGVMADLQQRFGVEQDRSCRRPRAHQRGQPRRGPKEQLDHVLATRLHRDPSVAAVLEAAASHDASFVAVGDDGTQATEVTYESRRYVVVDSPPPSRARRPGEQSSSRGPRTGSSRSLVVCALAASWIPPRSVLPATGSFATRGSLVAFAPRSPALRPVFHYTEKRVRGHVAVCVLAAVIEAVMTLDLAGGKDTDPDLEGQNLTARRALRELERVRRVRFTDANDDERRVITRPSPFQAKILAAFDVDTSTWRSRVA